ncbi:hypothetical protein TBR22_A03960 [Luteitalea sp. TBR-22]|uniref:hypothetical protein n=1 Tax=Luteitalea sp. TBR-22 TaxID=2802971 RepID=UPI001AF0E45D|nr:hypothetical protein [Luteitalea sp. TBR-22]BCS31196.1 hypothetical protein TBR22_A03960 [Luteitalea sp. TBR-22]
MPRATIVLVTVFVLAACTPCQGAMATAAALGAEVPAHLVAALVAWVRDTALPVVASVVLTLAWLGLAVASLATRRRPRARVLAR